MTDLDEHIRRLFAADLPPLTDPDFQADVLAALARRRFFGDVWFALAASLIGAFALAVLWPVLSPTLASFGQHLAPAAIAMMAAGSILWITSGRSLRLSF